MARSKKAIFLRDIVRVSRRRRCFGDISARLAEKDSELNVASLAIHLALLREHRSRSVALEKVNFECANFNFHVQTLSLTTFITRWFVLVIIVEFSLVTLHEENCYVCYIITSSIFGEEIYVISSYYIKGCRCMPIDIFGFRSHRQKRSVSLSKDYSYCNAFCMHST